MNRRLGFVFASALLASLTSQTSASAFNSSFALSPPSLSMSAEVGDSDVQVVTLTTDNSSVVMSPSTFTTSLFSDTQGGSCNQLYVSKGKPIPPKTSCTIEVEFLPTDEGTFTDTMTVTSCQTWRPNGTTVTCTKLGEAATVDVTGTATSPPSDLPDLTLTDPAFTSTDSSWYVRVWNIGTVDADLTNVTLQGWYSDDAILDTGLVDEPVCGLALAAYYQSTLGPGEYIDVNYACPATQFERAYFILKVDNGNALTESDETNNTAVIAQP